MKTIALSKRAFQNETLHDSTIRKWYRAFTDGKESVEIEYVGQRPRTVVTDVNINTVSAMIEENHRSAIR